MPIPTCLLIILPHFTSMNAIGASAVKLVESAVRKFKLIAKLEGSHVTSLRTPFTARLKQHDHDPGSTTTVGIEQHVHFDRLRASETCHQS